MGRAFRAKQGDSHKERELFLFRTCLLLSSDSLLHLLRLRRSIDQHRGNPSSFEDLRPLWCMPFPDLWGIPFLLSQRDGILSELENLHFKFVHDLKLLV